MILVVTGSRHVTNMKVFTDALADAAPVLGFTTLSFHAFYHGGAKGVDALAATWAEGRYLPHRSFPADWQRYDREAGPLRNEQMLATAVSRGAVDGVPVAVLAIPCPKCRGTWDCVHRARAMGLPVHVYRGLLEPPAVTPEGFFAWAWREGHELQWRCSPTLGGVEVVLLSRDQRGRPWGAGARLRSEESQNIPPLLEAAMQLSKAIRGNPDLAHVNAPAVKPA